MKLSSSSSEHMSAEHNISRTWDKNTSWCLEQTCKRCLTMFGMEKILKCWNHLSIKIFVNMCLNVRWRQFVDMPPFRKWSNMSYMSGLERGEVMRGEEEWPGIRGWPQLRWVSGVNVRMRDQLPGQLGRRHVWHVTCTTLLLTPARGTLCIRRSDIRDP